MSNRIDTGSRLHWAEAFGTRVTEIESRYPRRLPPLLGGNAPYERYRPYFGTGAIHACPELIGLPTLRLFFASIPRLLPLDNLSTRIASKRIAVPTPARLAIASVEIAARLTETIPTVRIALNTPRDTHAQIVA